MSTEPIKPGDLVYVARTCCAGLNKKTHAIGIPWRVARIVAETHERSCDSCGYKVVGVSYARAEETFGPAHCYGAPLAWLRKIPPLEELDDVKRKEEVPT